MLTTTPTAKNENNQPYVRLYSELLGLAKIGSYKEHEAILAEYVQILAEDPADQGTEVLAKAIRFLTDANRMGWK